MNEVKVLRGKESLLMFCLYECCKHPELLKYVERRDRLQTITPKTLWWRKGNWLGVACDGMRMREEVQILQTPKHSVTSSSCHLWVQYNHILLQSCNECQAFQEALPSGPGASLLLWHLLCKATSFTQVFAQTASFLRILPVWLICKEEILLLPFYLAFLLPVLLVLNHFFPKKYVLERQKKAFCLLNIAPKDINMTAK